MQRYVINSDIRYLFFRKTIYNGHKSVNILSLDDKQETLFRIFAWLTMESER